MTRSKASILLAAVISMSAIACSSSDSNDLKASLGDRDVVAKLREMALQAASTGESTPTTMYAVAVSDHQDAETALGGSIIYDHAPVYVIVIVGGPFTARGSPPGALAPQGDVLTLTIDAASYDVTDVGIGNVEPDLSKVALARVDLS
jgi:hypothetical protein